METKECKGSKLRRNIQNIINWAKEHEPTFNENDISDGYHTFNELYEFRKMYNATLFNEWASDWRAFEEGKEDYEALSGWKKIPKYDVHKSTKHHDGEDCFGGGWFIVVAMLPGGQITNHYKMEDWDLFKIPVEDKAKYEFDGHTGIDVIKRLKQLNNE